MTELTLIRHGETEWNRALRFQGQIDVPLNAVGHAQAERVARYLQAESFDAVICSDLQRAQQTAKPLLDLLGVKCVLEPGLREQSFGTVDGMQVEDIQRQFPDAWTQWLRFDADYAFEGAESGRQFHQRVTTSLVRHLGQGAAKLVVVTHGGVLDMFYRHAMGQSLSGPRLCDIPNGGINRLQAVLDCNGLRLTVQEWAGVSHLADMPPQPVYDQARLAREFSPKSA